MSYACGYSHKGTLTSTYATSSKKLTKQGQFHGETHANTSICHSGRAGTTIPQFVSSRLRLSRMSQKLLGHPVEYSERIGLETCGMTNAEQLRPMIAEQALRATAIPEPSSDHTGTRTLKIPFLLGWRSASEIQSFSQFAGPFPCGSTD